MLPTNYFIFLRSYLSDRKFYTTEAEATFAIQNIYAGVPKESVLGPILYLIYTADLPTRSEVVIATFADDTAILSTGFNPICKKPKTRFVNGLKSGESKLMKLNQFK